MLYYFENSVVGTLRLLFSNFVISELGGIACIRCTSMVQSLLAHYFLFFEAPHSTHLIRFFFVLVWLQCVCVSLVQVSIQFVQEASPEMCFLFADTPAI